jgi:predicted MFS family arabinose efflux permease
MDLHDRRESLYITINHSFVSLGSLAVTTYLIFLQMRFRVALVQTTVVVAVLGFLFLFARAPRREVTRGDRVGVVRLLFHQRPLALLFLGGLAAIGLGAGSIGLLTSFLMELRRFDQVTSKIGLAVFLSGLAVGRVVVGFMSKNEKSYDIATGFFALAGTLLGLLYFTPVFGVLTYVLVAAAGLSVAPILPFVIATAGLLYRHIPGTAMGLVKIAMPIGGIVVPALLSAVAAGFGFQASLAVFPVLGLGTSLVFLLSRGRVLASRADRS